MIIYEEKAVKAVKWRTVRWRRIDRRRASYWRQSRGRRRRRHVGSEFESAATGSVHCSIVPA